jgi:mTERF
MRFFKVEVGLSNPQLHTTLLAHPKLLDYSVDDVMRPSLQCLKANLGLPKPSLAAVITKAPRALQYPVESLEAKLLWYKTVMGFTKVELQKLVCLHPRYELLLLVTRHCCYCSLYKALQQHCCSSSAAAATGVGMLIQRPSTVSRWFLVVLLLLVTTAAALPLLLT